MFRRATWQVTNIAEQRLQQIMESRSEVSATSEPAQLLFESPTEAIKPIAKLIAAAVCVVALLVWLNRPTSIDNPTVQNVGIPIAQSTLGPDETRSGPSLLDQIVVDVKGDVAMPGLVTLRLGSRVADAIAAAGGLVGGADISSLNLAERLSDGQMIFIGQMQLGGASSDTRVNINMASVAELDVLPGVGPVMAGRIVAWRDTNQRFHSIEQLQEVPGIGPKVFTNLKPLIRI